MQIRSTTRRILGAMTSLAMTIGAVTAHAAAPPVTVNWLDGKVPAVQQNVNWGVPWPKGAVQKNETMTLKSADGKTWPMQTWPMAYWQDGSIKWSGHSLAATPEMTGPLQVSVGTTPAPAPTTPLTVTNTSTGIDIDTGVMRAKISWFGNSLIESLTIGDRVVAQDGKLIAMTEDRSEYASKKILKHEEFVSRIGQVTLEQSGPVRAVVKVEGDHKSTDGDRAWLPFVVRLYFNAGSQSIRIVHSFIYDGNPSRDFIKGLGLSFSVPFKEELHNRHMRFVGEAGDGGVWVQPVRLLPGYRNFPRDQYDLHLAGERMPNYGNDLPANVASVAVYNDAKLTQLGPDSFSVDKRTQKESSYLHVNSGRRSLGMAALADVSGGIAVGLKNFWQKYPASLEIANAASDVGQLKVWLWSPEAQSMDMRHYDIQGHALETNYEDWKPGWDNAYGVANTSDLTLWAFAEIPSNADLYNMAKGAAENPLLVCTPKYYHDNPLLGFWSLPDKSTPAKKWVEDQVEYLCDYYRTQVAERRWYGFWDYGDIMHNYDFGRHEWRYDVGGWAWNNNELAPDMFFYYMFLRSGRADIFRLAEAHTRHTSEVDIHHMGVFAPLGSRHNVNHWGDGAKQPRISQSGFKRFYYFLTADDRVGDLMHAQLDADLAYNRVRAIDTSRVPVGVIAGNLVNPWTGADMAARGLGRGRGGARGAPATAPADGEAAAAPAGGRRGRGGRGGAPAAQQFYSDGRPMEPRYTNVNFGLDWICYAINWTTEWERTGDPVWRDRVMAGMKSIVSRGEMGGGNFDIIFGGAEDLAMMEAMYDYPEFWAGWAQVCERLGATTGNAMTAPRGAAYAARALKSEAQGRRAWDALIGDANINTPHQPGPKISGPDVMNPRTDPAFLGASASWQLHGPASIQWALNALETMELAKDYLPGWETAARQNNGVSPTAPRAGGGGGRQGGRAGRGAAGGAAE